MSRHFVSSTSIHVGDVASWPQVTVTDLTGHSVGHATGVDGREAALIRRSGSPSGRAARLPALDVESDNRGVDADGPGPGSSGPAHRGPESAVEACWDEPAGQALARLREAGAPLLVVVDAEGNPQTVVPERTLAAAGPAQQVARCKPAWPAATFIQPASVEEARRLAARNESQPFLGHRTVVIENGQLGFPGRGGDRAARAGHHGPRDPGPAGGPGRGRSRTRRPAALPWEHVTASGYL